MITKHPWFGPKRWIGWGWTPISWEGWLVTVLALAAVLAASLIFRQTSTLIYVTIGVVAALVVICLLTGEPPGRRRPS